MKQAVHAMQFAVCQSAGWYNEGTGNSEGTPPLSLGAGRGSSLLNCR